MTMVARSQQRSLGPVRRRVVPQVDRPTSWTAALAGLGTVQREMSAVRRSAASSAGQTSSSDSATDTVSADQLAGRIEQGGSGDLTAVRRALALGDVAAPRIPASASSSPVVQRAHHGGDIELPDTPVGYLGQSEMSTSRLLDVQSWIVNLVDEHLQLELERRGLNGNRW